MYQPRAWTYVAVLAVCLCWSSLQAGVQHQVITDPAEVAVLKAIKKSLIDPNKNLSNWNQGDPCTANWTGIWCFDRSLDDGYLHVQELRLANMNLLGTLSPDLGRLSCMITLDFMWNNISGSIPKEIGNIASLELLLLSGNQLSGPLPEELGNLRNLDRIQIDENQISGPLPKSFANLDKTKHFFLDNNLSGHLPPEFSELPNLLILELDNNNFYGTKIPASYGNMSKLLKLLRNCNLQGPVPDLSRIPKLQYLDLSGNQLNGSISLGKLSDEITTINLSNNTLTGSIPINFSGLPQLQRLSIANNSLSGSVPAILWNDTTLNATERLILELQNNKLTEISGSPEIPQNVTVWLQGNPICLNGNLDNFCGSEIGDENDSESSTNSTASCPSQACPPPFENLPVVCFCAVPLLIKYRLKSPGFSDFHPYKSTFEEYLTSSLDLNLGQLDIASYVWENGPRLSMSLKLFPAYVAANANNSHFFDMSEVQRILGEFTSWKIPDKDLFGPYDLQITLLDPYIGGSSPPSPGSSSLSRDWMIGMSVGISIIILVIVSSIYISRKRILFFFKKDEKAELDVEALIRNYGSLTPKRYRYSDLHKITNSFKDQIGKGGFGTVYKGKLVDDDDLLVAVKVLRELEGGGEDFINEVVSIGRSSHVNVGTLVGFCYERDKRALIYEYMPNGSLDKFIRKQGSSSADCSLDYWKTLSKIAVGIARGLEYLHRGCNTRILHFDIKPQNILLDNDFCPKISDFGLAKLCKTKESIITHPGIRGTAGYMAPEVYSRNFGGVSHKSDVYSYGMLVLEMVGARRNLYSQVSESHTSEEFPHYIYKDLELLDSDENIYGATSEEEKEIARKMIIVGLGCIQPIPSDRPSMHKVLEMLEGPLQSLSVPPKPLFISTARYVAEASVTTSEPSESGQGNQF